MAMENNDLKEKIRKKIKEFTTFPLFSTTFPKF